MNNKQRKIKRGESILLVVPVLVLIVLGIWFQNRGPVKPAAPFKLVIQEVKITTLAKGPFVEQEPKTKGVKVVVFIGYEGPKPSWWGVGANPSSARVHFTGRNEKDDNYTDVGMYTGMDYDKAREQYTFVYNGEIPNDPNFLKQATCHVSVKLIAHKAPSKNLAAAKVSIPARENK